MISNNVIGNKECEEFCRKLPRKELQSLCKKYGLPARKPSSEMAASLFSYFQKHDLSFISSCKNVNLPSSLAMLQAQGPKCLTGHIMKGDSCPGSFHREKGSKANRNITGNELGSCLGAYNEEDIGCLVHYFQHESLFFSQCAGRGVFHKDALSGLCGRVENTRQCCCGNENTVDFPKDNVLSTMKSHTKAPASFEFYVNSEEGIKLCVDLNSSPSDWIKKYSNQISLCNNMSNTKSQSLHLELGHSKDSNKEMRSPVGVDPGEKNAGHLHAESSPSWALKTNDVGIANPDGENKLSMLSPSRTCGVVCMDVLDCLEEGQGHIGSKHRSDVQNHIISNRGSCSKNGSTAGSDVQKQIISNMSAFSKNGCSATVDSDITDTQTEKTACNFFVNPMSNDSINLSVVEYRSSKHDDEAGENLNMQTCSSLENNYVVLRTCMASCSTEIQLSETENYYKGTSCSPDKNGQLLDLNDSVYKIRAEQAALATSSENDYHCQSSLPTFSEEREWSNITNGRESSVCSQVKISDEKTCLKAENPELLEKFHKRRLFMDSLGQNSYNKNDAKSLRGIKRSIGEVLPRRSMRLVSK